MHDSIISTEERSQPPKGGGISISKVADDAIVTPSLANASVLVVDDQALLREAVAFEFEMLGCKAHQAENGEVAFKRFQELQPDVIISDIRMPVWDGVRLLDEVRRISKQTPAFIFMTGFSDLQLSMAYQRGVDAFLTKPLYPESLEVTLKRLLVPLEERWNVLLPERPAFKVAASYTSLEEAMLKKELMVGRCGLFLNKSLLPKNFASCGERLVAFQFSFRHGAITSLEGLARVRWIREQPDSAPAGVGVEHEFLVQSNREKLIRYVRDNHIIPVIPDGTVQG